MQEIIHDPLDAPPQRLYGSSRKARLDQLAQPRMVGWVERDEAPGEHLELLRNRGLLLQLLLRHYRARIDREAVVEQGLDHFVIVGNEKSFAPEKVLAPLLRSVSRRLLLLFAAGKADTRHRPLRPQVSVSVVGVRHEVRVGYV